MDVISNKNQILELLREIDKPSMLRLDESYYNDINFIHCIIRFKALSIYELDELINIDIDESLVKQSNIILINFTSSLNLKISEIEAITQIVSTKANFIDYHINLQIDFELDINHFDLLLIFVE
jgi:hypothetical protein